MAGADADGAVDANDGTPTEIEALRVTREESRAVLDHQIALLSEIADRTVRTVRLAGVTLGIVVSVLGLGGPSLLSEAGVPARLLVGLGTVSLLACVVVGVGTYSTSGANFGVNDPFRREVLTDSYSEREWLRNLLAAYDGWSAEMQRVIERNGVYLLVVQLLLLLGIACLSTAIALTAMTTYL